MKRLLVIAVLCVFLIPCAYGETINYDSGNKYVGEVSNGVPHGHGTLIFAGGDKYVGEWKDGKYHGQGTFTTPDGITVVGEFSLDEFWDGVYRWPDGEEDVYSKGEIISGFSINLEKIKTADAHYDAGRFVEGLKLYHELAEVGYAFAFYALGWAYARGKGVPKNDAEALKWYQKALMDPRLDGTVKSEAAWAINTFYKKGSGVPKDEAMAYAYRSIAKTLGDERAIGAFKMAEDYQRDYGEPIEPDYVVAQGQAMARQIWAEMEAAKGGKSEGKPDATAKKSGSTGSGFYINFQGHVITNSHVVNDCNQINTLQDGERTNTTVVINDSRNDLALLKTEKSPKTIAYFRSGRGIRAGEDILAFGYPFQSVLSDELKGTKGMVNALSGFNNDSRFMQISAPVQPGNSGGPLLDQAGNVVGVVTAKMDAVKMARYTGDIPQNVNFALKASLVRDMLEVKDVDYDTASSKEELKTVDIFEKAKRFTVLIECLQ